MKKGILFLCSMVILGFMPVNAQKVWSLEECIIYALERNLQIKRQELNVQYYKNNMNQSYFNTLPNLNAQLNESFTSGRAFDYYADPPRYRDQNSWYGTGGLRSSVTLFNGFQIINGIVKSRYDFLKSQSDLEKEKNDIQIQLALAYMQVLFSKELLQVAQKRLDVTTMQVERSRKLLDVGNIAQGEYLQIKAQEANDRTSSINEENNLTIAILNLTQLLDLDSTTGFDVIVPANIDVALLAPVASIQEIYAKALENMPQIKSAEYAVKSYEKQLAMAKGQISPSVSLNGDLSTFYSTENVDPENPTVDYEVNKQLKDDYNKQLSLGVSIPIFNRLQVKNSISNAKLQVDDYKIQLKQAEMALYKEVQQAHVDASAAREKYNSSVEAVNYNEESFKYTRQKMEVGLVNSVDFNLAQSNLTKAHSDMLQAKYEYIFTLKILDLYMGKQITL
jgi:outer membrane protein